MSIDLRGRAHISIHESDWVAVKKIAREFGWVPEYVRMFGEITGLQHDVDDVPEHNARALARALYGAICMIEADSLSEPLVELVKEAGVESAGRCRPRLCGFLLYRLGDHRPRTSPTSPPSCAKAVASQSGEA